jgi:peroxiredoxin
LLEIYAIAGNIDEFKLSFEKLFEPNSLDFGNYMLMMKCSSLATDWESLSSTIASAESIANEKSIINASPGRVFNKEYLKQVCDMRKGFIGFYQAWKVANTGRLDEALIQFASADSMISKNFFGVPDEGFLYVLWGRALLLDGQDEIGMEKIARGVLWSQDEELFHQLQQVYITRYGREKSFEEYVQNLRVKYAKKIENFSAKDYFGQTTTFDQLKGKVSILQFWAYPCGPCHTQLILFRPFFNTLRPLGLAYIGYTLEPNKKEDLKFIADNKLEYTFLSIAEKENWRPYRQQFNVMAFPTTYIIDREGRILYYHLGFSRGDEEKYAREIEGLLR